MLGVIYLLFLSLYNAIAKYQTANNFNTSEILIFHMPFCLKVQANG